MSNDAFISYSRRDKDFIKKLAVELDKNEITYWVDWEGIPLASEWWKEIEQGIETADNFIFVITEDSVKSEVCGKEIAHAIKSHKRIVPVLWREIEDKEVFKSMHEAISSHNWIFMKEGVDFDAATKSLVDTVKADPGHIKEHTRILIRAREWENDNRDSAKLLGGTDVDDAEAWLAQAVSKDPQPAQLHHEYVQESRKRQRKMQRRLLTGVSIALVISVALTILSAFLYEQAEQNRREAEVAKAQAERNAEEALSLALSASSQLALLANNEIDLAVALAVAANGIEVAPMQVERVLADAVYSPGTRFVLDDATDDINSVRFSPDGTLALTASADGEIRLYDIQTSELIHNFPTEGQPLDLAIFSHDGKMLGMGDCSAVEMGENEIEICIAGEIIIYDIETGEELQIFSGHTDEVVSLAFSPDDKQIMSGSADTTARIWDIETGEELFKLEGHNGTVVAVDFHPTEAVVLTYGIQSAPMTWDLETGELIHEFTQHQKTGEPNLLVSAAVFSPDGENILSSYGFDLRLWDYKSGALRRRFTGGHTSFVNSISFDSAGNFFVSSAWRENGFFAWSVINSEPQLRFDAHDDIVNSVSLSPTARYALSGSLDNTVRIWELTNGAAIQTYSGSSDDIFSVAVHPEGKVMASGGFDDIVHIWDIESGENIAEYEGAQDDLWTIVYSPDGTLLAATGKDKIIRIMESDTGKIVHELEGHSDWVTALAFGNHGKVLASGSNDRSVKLWDVETGEEIKCFFAEACIGTADGQLRALAFSSDDSQLLVGADTARLMDVETGEMLQQFRGHTSRVNSVAFSSDGERVLTGSADSSIRMWSIASGRTLLIFEGHVGQIRSVVFDQSNQYILSASADGTLRLWDVATGLETRRYVGHKEWVNQAVFTPDGTKAISASWDDTLIEWYIHDSVEELNIWAQENRYIRQLTCNEQRIYLVDGPESCD